MSPRAGLRVRQNFHSGGSGRELAAQRIKLQQEHARQIKELELRVEATKLGAGLGVVD